MQETKCKFIHNLLIASFLFLSFFLVLSLPVKAADEGGEGSETSFIMHHVKDAHEWHFATIGHTHITLPLPVILYSPDRGLEVFMSSKFYDENHNRKPYNGYIMDAHEHIVPLDEGRKIYDFSITKNVAQLIICFILLLVVFLGMARRYKNNPQSPPKGLQSLFEPIIVFIRDEVAIPGIGKEQYARFMPFLLTLFFFIWFGNIVGLIPGAANLTGNIAVTFTLAILTFIVTNVNGNKGYWKHIFWTPGVPKIMLPLLVPVEFMGLFTKPFSLMIRLFVAITAGHIVILSLIALAFIFNSFAVGIGSTLIVTFINLIELLVATIQAYVFTLFTSMYIGQAVATHDDH